MWLAAEALELETYDLAMHELLRAASRSRRLVPDISAVDRHPRGKEHLFRRARCDER